MKIIVNGKALTIGKDDRTVLDALRNNGIRIRDNCEGNCACGQCLVEFEKNAYALMNIENEELDLLEKQINATGCSRLACQVKLSDLEKTGIGEIEVNVGK
ncbi:MAG: (2Fe-2S)-binding protein [Rickettsiales bacterium]|jgi:ferredoxin|nr:(2Fe-2S)-binding protein [Rickettsiales bacterium]